MSFHQAPAVIGIDVGGTGIKGAVVDVHTGCLLGPRAHLATPRPATPAAVGRAIGELAGSLDFAGPIGVAFPSAIRDGQVMTAANLDGNWIGRSIDQLIDVHLPTPAAYLNDADAAALAEARYGAGREQCGLIVMVTFGTGIGTALVHDGRLVPNAELGHIEIDGVPAEPWAAASAISRDVLGWDVWAARADRYLRTLEKLLFPELFVLGGGISESPENWVPRLQIRTPVRVARLAGDAGIIGAALAASDTLSPKGALRQVAPEPVRRPGGQALGEYDRAGRVQLNAVSSGATRLPSMGSKQRPPRH